MKLNHVFLGTVAASGFMLVATVTDPAIFRLFSEAQAATNVSININTRVFYDRLAPYGSWVRHDGRYVWIPERVNRHWRPYTEGHWSYTRRYGWLWVSNERFGWATYHYGRWGYSRNIGWYWVPGRRWGPAWVAWNHTGNDVAWAPLPPRHGNDVSISISFGDIPDYYWQAVPTSAFLSINLSDRIIRDRDRVRKVARSGEPKTVKIENNIVVNDGIDVGMIEKSTKKKVKVLEERAADNPEAAGKTDDKSVAIFNPEVTEEADAKPAKIKKSEDVMKQRKADKVPALDQNAEAGVDTTTQPDNGTDVPLEKPKKKDKAIDTAVPEDSQQTAEPPKTDELIVDQQNTDQQPTKKKKKDAGTAVPEETQQIVEPPKTDEPIVNQQNTDQQPTKKKKKDVGTTDQQSPENTQTTPTDEGQSAPAKKDKKKKATQPGASDGNGQPVCDPAVEDCPPAE